MRVYTVLAPPEAPADPARVVLVKEGFSWPVLFIPVLWLIAKRMWLWLIAYLVVFGLLGVLGEEVGGPLPGIVIAGLHVLLALEANELYRRSMIRRGLALVGVTGGANLEEAEIRYFAEHADGEDRSPADVELADGTNTAKSPAKGENSDDDVVGLFPAPQGPAA